jgi:hydrogenase expression/formation protein HypC
MCLSIPAKIEEIHGEMARVSVNGVVYEASLQMVPDAKAGDYILMHTGFALQIISEEEAKETLQTFQEFDELNKQLDEEEKKSGQRIV